MNNCKVKILQTILERPITMMELSKSVSCATETVQKYTEEYQNNGKISCRKSKFKIFHNPKLESKKVDFFEVMLNSTVSDVVQIMLHSSELTQQELSEITRKSLPSVSRALSELVIHDIVQINYYAPGKTWSIKNKQEIISFLKETHPKIIDSMTSNMAQMLTEPSSKIISDESIKSDNAIKTSTLLKSLYDNFEKLNIIEKITLTSIWNVLSEIGTDEFQSLQNQLRTKYDKSILESISNPTPLKNILFEIYGNSSNSILQSINDEIISHKSKILLSDDEQKILCIFANNLT